MDDQSRQEQSLADATRASRSFPPTGRQEQGEPGQGKLGPRGKVISVGQRDEAVGHMPARDDEVTSIKWTAHAGSRLPPVVPKGRQGSVVEERLDDQGTKSPHALSGEKVGSPGKRQAPAWQNDADQAPDGSREHTARGLESPRLIGRAVVHTPQQHTHLQQIPLQQQGLSPSLATQLFADGHAGEEGDGLGPIRGGTTGRAAPASENLASSNHRSTQATLGTGELRGTMTEPTGRRLQPSPPAEREEEPSRGRAGSPDGTLRPTSPHISGLQRQTNRAVMMGTQSEAGIARPASPRGQATRKHHTGELKRMSSSRGQNTQWTTMRAGGAALTPAVPSRLKLKVTDEVRAAIRERLTKASTHYGQSGIHGDSGLFSPTSGIWRGRTMGKPKQFSLQDEVDCFIELTCTEITKKDVLLVQRGPPKPWFIFNPNSLTRIRWDLLMLLILTWSAFSIPYRLAFHVERMASMGLLTWDYMVDAIYCMDVIFNFVTGYYEDNVLVTNWRTIAWRYLVTWFMLDIVSSLPLDGLAAGGNTSGMNIIRMCKLVRFMRYAGYFEAKAAAMYISATLVRLATIIILIIWFWHIVACGYWWLSVESGLGVSEWALRDAQDTPHMQWLNYLRSVEWALQTTFSYAPSAPSETVYQAYFTLSAVMGGVVMTSVIIGSASTALQSLDAEKEVRRQRMDKVMNYLKRRKIPGYFQKIVLDYYGYMSDKHSQDSIIHELPITIQARMSLLLNRDLLKFVPALRMLDLNSIISLMQSLYSRVFLPGEFVFRAGDVGMYLYFIKTGACEIVLPDGKNVACNLVMGEIGGQLALINDTSHDFSLRVSEFSEVLFLEKEVYEEIALDSERFAEYVETEAIKQEQIVRTATANLHRFAKLGRIQSHDEAAIPGKTTRGLGNMLGLHGKASHMSKKDLLASRVLPVDDRFARDTREEASTLEIDAV